MHGIRERSEGYFYCPLVVAQSATLQEQSSAINGMHHVHSDLSKWVIFQRTKQLYLPTKPISILDASLKNK